MQHVSPNNIKQFLLKNASFMALFLICILIVFLEIILKGETIFIQPENLTNILMQVTINGILAVGMTFVILTGGIDLSVGSMIALMGVVFLRSQNYLFSLLGDTMGFAPTIALTIFTALAVTLIIGAALGLLNGYMISRFLIPPFIITLGMMSIGRGGALLLSGATGLSDEPAIFKQFASIDIPKIPSAILLLSIFIVSVVFLIKKYKSNQKSSGSPISSILLLMLVLAAASYAFIGNNGIPLFILVFIIIAVTASVMLKSTTFGRKVYALGGNEEAARLSGIKVHKIKIYIYAQMAFLATVGALMTVARQGGISPGVSGNMGELDAIASVVIGGTSLSGGIGTIGGTIIGALIMGILNNGMNLLSIPTNWGYIMKGLVVIVAVWFDITSRKKIS